VHIKILSVGIFQKQD